MQWLTPGIAGIAAALALPTLVLMYFLRLRRREAPVSSTLLWQRAVRDLQVNAPFQRLRRNILLLLQLLILAVVLLALAGPVLALTGAGGRRVVLLIDRSASMGAADAPDGRTRLAEAKRLARQRIASLRPGSLLALGGGADRAMVIAFDRHAKVLCSFTSDRARLAAAVSAIEPTDAPTALAEAVTVARAFAQSAGAEESDGTDPRAARLELFGDGRIADLADLDLLPGEMVFHRVGRSGANLAVTAMQARRSYEKPEQVHVFASVVNYGDRPVETDVQLAVGATVRAVRRVSLPPTRPAGEGRPPRPGKAAVSFVMTQPGAGVVSVRHLTEDALAADDAAWVVLPGPRKLTAMLVTAGNPPLETALAACPLARLDVRTPAAFDELCADDPVASPYDVVVLDGHAPEKLPRGRYIIFGRPPEDIGLQLAGPLRGQVAVDWRDRHPVLRFVNLGNFFASKAIRLVPPRDAAVLAEFAESPAMVLLRRSGSTFLVAPFDVLETNWPFEAGFAMFCYNATAFLGTERQARRRTALEVGEAITLRAGAADEATVTDPSGRIERVAADPSGTIRWPRTHRVGVYTVQVGGREPAHFAVNLTDEAESRIEPVADLAVGAGGVGVRNAEDARTNRRLWPWLVLAALVLVCVEWLVYNSKVRL